MCTLVGQGLGYGVLPERVARHFAKAIGLTLVRLAEPWAERRHAICMQANEEIGVSGMRLVEFLLAHGDRQAKG